MSSRLSATYQAASTAAESVTDRIQVRIVDSLTVTVGEGLLVLSAVDMAEEGKPVDEIATSLEDLMSRTRVYGLLESLDFLRRGGRIGGAAHLMGSLLSIKPVLEVREGIVEVESKQRTRQRSLRYLASKALEAGPLERLAIANGAAKDVGELQEMLNGADVAHEIVMTDLGPVIGSHAGPGAIGVCFQLAR
jgi:DegV family protein with EDD domain